MTVRPQSEVLIDVLVVEGKIGGLVQLRSEIHVVYRSGASLVTC